MGETSSTVVPLQRAISSFSILERIVVGETDDGAGAGEG